MKKSQKYLALTILMLVRMFFSPADVYSQSLTFGIKPENPASSYFEYTLNPGESIDDAVIAKSYDNAAIILNIAPVDAITGINGGLSYDYKNTTGTSTWVSMEKTDALRLLPSHISRIPFKVTVPAGTPPGEYVAGFLAGLVQPVPTEKPGETPTARSFSVNIVTRMAVPIIIHVPGEVKCKFDVDSFKTRVFNGEWNFSLILTNKGNVHVSSSGNIIVLNKKDNLVETTIPITFGYFVPGTNLEADFYTPVPEEGEYSIKLSLSDLNIKTCNIEYSQDVTYGKPEQQQYSTQSTLIAKLNNAPTPKPEATSGIISQVKQPGTTYWYVWLSAVVLLISIGFVFYALSILKRNKK